MLEGPEAPVQLPGRAEDEVAVEKQADSMYPVFPSLHDEDLERLGVLAAQARRHRASAPSSVSSSPVGSPSHGFGCGGMSDKDIESKYAGLSVAFKADRVTLDQRLLRQQRQRDLAETNMAAEFTRLLEIHKRLSRATSDAERGDFLESFRSQLDALDHASRQVSWAAEMYGAVQQEDRLSHAMEVIDLYVESLKRLHQKLCQELEEKKLSENNMSVDELQDSTDEPPPRTTRYRSLSALTSNPSWYDSFTGQQDKPTPIRYIHNHNGTKRRASIAAIPRPGSLGSSPVNGDVPVLSRSPGSTEGRPGSGRWSAPSRIRRVSLAMDQVPNDSHTPSQDRRDSRADSVYAHSNSASCMSEIAELSESRRESATDQADHSTSDNSCLMKALSHNGVGSSISNLLEHHPDDDDEDDDDHHHQHPDHLQPMAPNGVRRGHGAPQHVLNSMALLTDYWAQGRQLASEFWYSVSKDSFRWLRLWTVCALLVASAAVLLTALMPNTRSADRPS